MTRLLQIRFRKSTHEECLADDVALHFSARGYRGKAMFVAVDKATAVRMYDKVKTAVGLLIEADEAALKTAGEAEGAALLERLDWMRALDMAVVISQSQNEIADLDEISLDIRPHRARMLDEDLETKFKDPADPFRLVFVCAMWITGFDAPSIGTIYLDKPMKNHTLMQTIARANRRALGKTSGVIVDYTAARARARSRTRRRWWRRFRPSWPPRGRSSMRSGSIRAPSPPRHPASGGWS